MRIHLCAMWRVALVLALLLHAEAQRTLRQMGRARVLAQSKCFVLAQLPSQSVVLDIVEAPALIRLWVFF